LNILFTVDRFGVEYGGISSAVSDLAQSLVKHGHSVTIYTSRLGSLTVPGVAARRFRSAYSILGGANFTLPMLLANYDFDVAHLFGSYYTFQTFATILRARCPIIYQPHGSVGFYRLPLFMDSLWRCIFDNSISRVISSSPRETDACRTVNLKNIVEIPNGVNLTYYTYLPPRSRGLFRSSHGIPPDAPLVLYLGRIDSIKGIDVLLGAMPYLPDNYQLVVVGDADSPYGRSLVQSAPHNVLFAGPLYGRDKLLAYADASVFVLPSRGDAFGLTLLEALACGVPVVVSDNCGLSSAIGGDIRLGTVVPLSSPLMADAIRHTVDYDTESDHAYRIVWASGHSWDKTASQIESVYRDVIEKQIRRKRLWQH